MNNKLFLFIITFASIYNLQSQYTLTIDDVAFSDGVITDYLNTVEKDIVIPDNFNGIAVTAIGDFGFAFNDVSSVVIPSSVISIGDGAFYVNELTNIEIPNSVTYIGQSSLSYNDLNEIIIPNSVTFIGEQAFRHNKLTSVILPSTLHTIETRTFSDNLLTQIIIPNTVVSIGSGAFYNNKLTDITIPNSVVTIESDAFTNNNLSQLSLNESLEYIGNRAFRFNNLTEVIIPASVNYIGPYSFDENSKLTNLILPISNYLDKWVDSENSSHLDGVSVTNFNLAYYRANAQGQYTLTLNDVDFSDGIIKSYLSSATNIIIPDKFDNIPVTALEGYTFANRSLIQVILPNSIISIGAIAFANNNLTQLVIPAKIKSIRSQAFANNNITQIVLPDSIKTIGERAFYANNLTQVSIPSSVTSIGFSAFDANPDFTPFILPESNTGKIWSDYYNNIYQKGDTISNYENSYYRANEKGQYVLTIDDVEFKNGEIINYLTSIRNILIPNKFGDTKVTSIGEYAFQGAGRLNDVELPNSLTHIGELAFDETDIDFVLPNSFEGYAYNWLYRGWQIYNSGDTVNYLNDEFIIDLSSRGEAVDFNIIYHLDSLEHENPVIYTVEDATIILQDPIKSGYVFSGWFTDCSFNNQITEIPSGSYNDIDLYPKFLKDIATGLTARNQEKLTVYPNPASDVIIFNISEEIHSIEVLNSSGSTVKSVKSNTNQINISKLNNGVYLLKVETLTGTFTKQFVKSN